MPPDTMGDKKIDMRRTKLKAEEAALLSGELKKPSWQSRNEGIHERVSFEDSIWGFDLAGGSFYKTPLRVVNVKPDSRAQKAGIRIGDRLKRINDIDTSTLTIQEAHEIIIESGVHLKIAVTAPEDEEDAYFCYEDPIEDGYDSEEERRLEEEKARKRQVHAKVSSYWSLQWPWVSKRRVIWHESNCYMVPSKYENNHREMFPQIPQGPRKEDDIVLHSVKNDKEKLKTQEELNAKSPQSNLNNAPAVNPMEPTLKNKSNNSNTDVNGNTKLKNSHGVNGNLSEIPESEEEFGEISQSDEIDISNSEPTSLTHSDEDSIAKVDEEEPNNDNVKNSSEIENSKEDDVISEVLGKNESKTPRVDEDSVIESILSDSEEQMENSTSVNER